MFKSVLVLDLFLKLNRENELDIISEKDKKLFNQIVSAMKRNDFNLLITNRMTINAFLDATLEFMDAPAYLKVEMFKALDFEDIELIKNFNPFFSEEYEKYNVDIDQRFMVRQITKWINGKKDEELAINEAARFLINTFKMDIDIKDVLLDILNSNDPDTVNQALFNEDVDQVAGYVKAYYDKYRPNTPKLK